MFSGLAVLEENHRKRWTALTSFTLQGILVTAALVLPLLHPANLPEAFAHQRIFTPVSAGEPRVQQSSANTQPSTGGHLERLVVRPDSRLHFGHAQAQSSETVDAPNLLLGAGPGTRDGVLGSLSDEYVQPVYYPAPAAKPRPVSVVMEGNLIQRVQPQYPAIARQIRLQGDVIIRAVISREGAIEQATVVSGPGLLAPAALSAVKQWRYRPYYLNGQPVEVETQITVKFILNQ